MKREERGFSLIELMVALTVTLMVTGAVYKLVTAGQSAFRREPALADRQQNIRMAMDIITRDVLDAGYQLPRYVQVFTRGLDGSNIAASPMGSSGEKTDELEFYKSNADCPPVAVCDVGGSELTFKTQVPSCILGEGETGDVLFISGTEMHVVSVKNPGKGGGNNACKDGNKDKNGHFTNPGKKMCPDATGPKKEVQDLCDDPGYDPDKDGVFCGSCPTFAMSGEVVRYRIRPDSGGTPNLERSRHGSAGPWEIVARGVEDLQVQYRRGLDADWEDDPGLQQMPTAGVAGDPNTVVWRVRIDLGARVVGEANLAGQTRSAADTGSLSAPRGRLVAEIAPRAAQALVATELNHEQ